jgi:hypothetical protein
MTAKPTALIAAASASAAFGAKWRSNDPGRQRHRNDADQHRYGEHDTDFTRIKALGLEPSRQIWQLNAPKRKICGIKAGHAQCESVGARYPGENPNHRSAFRFTEYHCFRAA